MRPGVDPKKLSPIDALDCFLDAARQGAEESWLAEQADVSVRQVRQWKKMRGFDLDNRTTARGVQALVTLSSTYEPSAHHTAADLAFEVPEFVVREPLQYSAFARACFHLYHEAMLSPGQVAQAMGVRVSDVDLALLSWRRHLRELSQKCLGCDTLLDPRFGSFCSRSCHDQHIPRPDDL